MKKNYQLDSDWLRAVQFKCNTSVKSVFTITTEIHARSLANFYCQYADRRTKLKFMRRVSERERAIDQFRYIKIQSQTIDLRTRLRGINPTKLCIYSPEPRNEVYCLRLNFNISKLVYSTICYRKKQIDVSF